MAEVRNPYLHKHDIPHLVDALMRRIIAEQPADPIRFLIGELVARERERRVSAVGGGDDRRARLLFATAADDAGDDDGGGAAPLPAALAAVGPGGERVADPSPECWDYPSLQGCCSELARVLTPELWRQLRHVRTRHGAGLDDVVQVGIDVREHMFAHSCGCVAADAECYDTFAPLLRAVVRQRHRDWQGTHPAEELQADDLTDRAYFPAEFVTACVASLDRSLADCAFPCFIDRGTRRLVTAAVAGAAATLPKELEAWRDTARTNGTWRTAEEIQVAQRGATAGATAAPLLPPFPPRGEYDVALHLTRDWPDGRGAWTAEDGGLAVCASVYEHLHIRVVGEGGDVYTPLRRLFAAARHMRAALAGVGLGFTRTAELGSVVCNPDNLGTSFGCAARLRIPLLCVHQRFDGVLDKLGLECLTDAELQGAAYFGLSRTAAADGGHPRLSSAAANSSSGCGACWVRLVVRLGISESRAAGRFVAAVHSLIELEQLLQRGQAIEVSIGLE